MTMHGDVGMSLYGIAISTVSATGEDHAPVAPVIKNHTRYSRYEWCNDP